MASRYHFRMALLERDRPLAALSAAVERAVRGGGSVIAVLGEAGIVTIVPPAIGPCEGEIESMRGCWAKAPPSRRSSGIASISFTAAARSSALPATARPRRCRPGHRGRAGARRRDLLP